MEDKIALYTMFGLVKLLHFHLGWNAQVDLSRVGEEFIDALIEEEEVTTPHNDIDAVLTNVAKVLTRRYHVAHSITVEIADDLPVATAAIMPPYRICVQNCAFQGLHQLFLKYDIRRNWRRTPAGRDGMFLICPLMNFLVHAIETSSDYLAGHCLEATTLEGTTCTCLIDVFSRTLDISSFPEEKNPEVYRIR